MNIDVVLTFDVEDVYFDPREGGDDHPIWIAKILETHDLTGTFLFVGDKVRRLKRNQRNDVAKALVKHSIGMHVNSNMHPTIPEFTAPVDWDEGLKRVRADEKAFAVEFEAFFGRPPEATSRHSVLGATQQYAVAAEMKLPTFYGVPADIPSVNDISFCCGALNTPSEKGLGFIGTGFDRSYSDDQQTDICIAQLDQRIHQCQKAGKTFLNIFLGHPVMMRGVSPWFIYFLWPNGQNLSRAEADALGQAPIKPSSVMPKVKFNFERICRYIAQHPSLEVIGVREMQRRYGWQKKWLSQEDLNSYFNQFNGTRRDTPLDYMGDIPLGNGFSPAEAVTALTESVVAWSSTNELPKEAARRDVLGPTELPLVCPELPSISRDQIIEVAKYVLEKAQNGYLPGNIPLQGRRIGLGSYFQGVSDFYRQIQSRKVVRSVELSRVSLRYPSFAHEIDAMWRRMILEDGTMDAGIDLEQFCRYARLQSWTVKRAHRIS